MLRKIVAVIVALMMTVSPMGAAETDATLRRGDSGEAVIALQQRLRALGYLHDRADGVYGYKTESAINRFERRQGLKADGVATESVLDALYGDDETAQAMVVIAPSGKRYHLIERCRGLNSAKSTTSVGFLEAKVDGRTPCILCYGRLALYLAQRELIEEIGMETSVGIVGADQSLEPAA